MRHYDEDERRKGVVRDGEHVRVPLMMADSARPRLDAGRMTMRDIAEMGRLPAGISAGDAEELQPIAEALRTIGNRERALEIKHQIEIAHTRISTRLDGMQRAAQFGSYGPNGQDQIEEDVRAMRAALTWLEVVHQTIQGATAGLRDAMMQADQDRAEAYADAAREEYERHLNTAWMKGR